MIEKIYPNNPQDKEKAAANAIKEIQKEFGEGSVIDMQSRIGRVMPCIPSGLYDLDHDLLGVGGLPRGRIVEVYGPESSGKTTLALTFIASAQKAGELCALIDAEHALDPAWAKVNGVDVGKLLVSQPDYGEQGLEILVSLVESGAFALIVVDSVAALTPKAEIDGEVGDSHMGLQARMMSQCCRKLAGIVNKSNTTVVFINQLREKIGVMFGSPETTTGGKSLKFYASVRLDVRKQTVIKEGDLVIGNLVKIKGVKNKVSAPYKEAIFNLLYDRGFDIIGSVLDAGVSSGVVDKAGAWYSYKNERLGQGRKAAADMLGTRPDYAAIYKEIVSAKKENRV